MAEGRPSTIPPLGAVLSLLKISRYTLIVPLTLALAKSLGEHLQCTPTLDALTSLLDSPPTSSVLPIVTLTTFGTLPPNMIPCRRADAEPQKRTTMPPVFPIVLKAPPTRRLWSRISIRTAILLGTQPLLTSAWRTLHLALDVEGKLILTLPTLTLISAPNTLSPRLRPTGLTRVRPLLWRLIEY